MALSKRLRYEILRRDNHTCRYCGASAPDVSLTVDHVTPVALGGTDEPENLVTACRDCNAGKSSSSPDAQMVADVQQDALRWRRAMEAASLTMEHYWAAERDYIDQVIGAWESWVFGVDKEPAPIPDNARSTISKFYRYGLPLEVAIEMVDVATGAAKIRMHNRFRYFCGCCWNRIAELQNVARDLFVAEEEGDEWPG